MPEGAADEEVVPVNRGQPGDGSETNERSYAARRDPPRYKSDRGNDVSRNDLAFSTSASQLGNQSRLQLQVDVDSLRSRHLI